MSIPGEHMGENNRKDWKISRPVTEVLQAATDRRDFYKGRWSWWLARREKVKADLKEHGITFDETDVPLYSNSGRLPRHAHDARMARDLSECNQKVSEHQTNAIVFNGWVEFLQARVDRPQVDHEQEEDVLWLLMPDYLYFFGELDPREIGNVDS